MAERLAATLGQDSPVTSVAGVSSGRAAAFLRLGIKSVRDLLTHYPRRYLDMLQVASIGSARIGEKATIVAIVHEAVVKRPKPKLDLVEVTLVDGTGTLIATFFRQPWLAKTLTPGTRVSVAGQVDFNYGFKRMTMPFMDRLDSDESVSEGKIIPLHPATEKVPTGQMRRIIANALDQSSQTYDMLPLELRAKYRLMSHSAAMRAIHFPHSMPELAQAKRRLAYEEVLLLELHLMADALRQQGENPSCVHRADGPAVQALRAALPFPLTQDQENAVFDLLARMASPERMLHMLLGDVGTGKTIVSAFALASAADTGTQALMMGPTEVLAEQYAKSLGPLLDKAGVTWGLLTGSTSAEDRRGILDALADGSLSVLFGTHALLEKDVVCHACSIVVIDEEQRFGVGQRDALVSKGVCPDILAMTATPIPRSLALALYGSMTLSYLRQVPFDRPPRTTKVFGFRERGKAYDIALEACRRGEQAYVVCPLVGKKAPTDGKETKQRDEFVLEEDEAYIDSDADMADDNPKAAKAEAAFLKAKTFAEFEVGLLHGRMKPDEKRRVMDAFRAGEIDVLVSTTVIEVGVDVPNATVMIVEDADRFGLSQLHQLRGRVGRGRLPGCVCLVSSSSSEEAMERLAAMERTDDGFELAEFDLSLRREGDILGNRQHGASGLKLVNVIRDGALIEAAHADAVDLLAADPQGETLAMKMLLREADAYFGEEARTL